MLLFTTPFPRRVVCDPLVALINIGAFLVKAFLKAHCIYAHRPRPISKAVGFASGRDLLLSEAKTQKQKCNIPAFQFWGIVSLFGFFGYFSSLSIPGIFEHFGVLDLFEYFMYFGVFWVFLSILAISAESM